MIDTDTTLGAIAEKYGIPNANASGAGLTNISISGGTVGLGDGAGNITKVNNNWEVDQAFTLIKGNHELKFGVDYQSCRFAFISPQYPVGQFAFSGAYTGNGFADFLAGRPISSELDINQFMSLLRFQTSFYVQDNWRVGFTEGVQPGEVQDWTNLKAEVSQLSYNVPQLLVISYVQDLPFGKGKRFLSDTSGVVDKVVSGWGIDGITSLHSGFPLPLTAQPTYLYSIFGAGYARPNVVPGCDKKVSGSAFSRTLPGATWFNTSCFTQPGQFQFGNEARVDPDLRMQGVANWDLSLFKATAVTERFNVQFRAEIFNLFNRVQLGYPNLVCCSTSNKAFGTIGSQLNSPRQIQFALKMIY